MHGEVKKLFCNALLIVMPIRMIVAILQNIMTFSVMEEISYSNFEDGSYMNQLTVITANPVYTMLTILGNVLFMASIIFMVIDIMGIYKANYRITGLVLFGIFLNYGYYIWRAYILGQKKTAPIIYTVCYTLLAVINMVISVIYTANLSMGILNSMY